MSAMDRARLELLVCRLKRSGFFSAVTPNVATRVAKAADRLFQAIIADPNYDLRKHFQDISSTCAIWPICVPSLIVKESHNFEQQLMCRDLHCIPAYEPGSRLDLLQRTLRHVGHV